MKACTLVFAAKATGAGDQIVTGIVDQHGDPFEPIAFVFQGYSALNAQTLPFRISTGFDDGTGHCSGATNDVFQVGGKLVGSGGSGQHGVLGFQSGLFFGGTLTREAYVSATAVGEFILTYDLNTVTGDSIMVTAFGGADLDTVLSGQTVADQTGPNGIGIAPVALLFGSQTALGTIPGTGAGSGGASWTFTTGPDHQGGSKITVNELGDPGNNSRQQDTGVLAPTGAALLSLEPDGFKTTSNTGMAYLAFGGVRAASGTLTQPLTPGLQEIITGVDIRWLFLMSYGAVAGASILTDYASLSVGMADGTRQSGHLTGESRVGNGQPMLGAQYLRDDCVLMFTEAFDGASTVISVQAAVTEFSPDRRSFFLDWSKVDGVAREVLWLVLGDTPPAPTPPGTLATTEHVIRRVRRSPHVNDEKKRMICHRFELDLQTGIGNVVAPADDPVVQLFVSRDGGKTFARAVEMRAGALGAYTTRCFATMLGQSRDFVFEVVVSDPVVPWAIANAYVTMSPGTS